MNYILVHAETGLPPTSSEKKKLTGGFPRGYDHTFDPSDRGLAWAQRPDRPKHGPQERAVQSQKPTMIDGVWVYEWTVEPIAPVEIHRQINRERERRLEAGSAFSVTGIADPIPLTGRPFDQTVYLALLTRASGYKAAGVTDPVLRIRAGNDVIHMLTPNQMIELVSAAMGWFEQVMATSWAMKDGTAPFENGIFENFTAEEHWP